MCFPRSDEQSVSSGNGFDSCRRCRSPNSRPSIMKLRRPPPSSPFKSETYRLVSTHWLLDMDNGQDPPKPLSSHLGGVVELVVKEEVLINNHPDGGNLIRFFCQRLVLLRETPPISYRIECTGKNKIPRASCQMVSISTARQIPIGVPVTKENSCYLPPPEILATTRTTSNV